MHEETEMHTNYGKKI